MHIKTPLHPIPPLIKKEGEKTPKWEKKKRKSSLCGGGWRMCKKLRSSKEVQTEKVVVWWKTKSHWPPFGSKNPNKKQKWNIVIHTQNRKCTHASVCFEHNPSSETDGNTRSQETYSLLVWVKKKNWRGGVAGENREIEDLSHALYKAPKSKLYIVMRDNIQKQNKPTKTKTHPRS